MCYKKYSLVMMRRPQIIFLFALLLLLSEMQKLCAQYIDDVVRIQFLDKNTGWLIQRSGTLSTYNPVSGTWEIVTHINPRHDRFFAVFFVNKSTGYVLKDNGVLKSSDSGMTWFDIMAGTPCSNGWYSGVSYLNDKIWLVSRWRCIIEPFTSTSTIAWLGLDQQLFDYSQYQLFDSTSWRDIATLGPNKKLIVGKTYDAGAGAHRGSVHYNDSDDLKHGWQVVFQDSILERELYSVAFYDSMVGFACGDAGLLIKTEDSGINWQVLESGRTERLNQLFVQSRNVVWAVGDSGLILKTEDVGESWRKIDNESQHDLFTIASSQTDSIWVGGSGGELLFSPDGGQSWRTSFITSVADESPDLPQSFVLFQNYPNPFNSDTKIKYELHESSGVQFTVYDLAGRVIETRYQRAQPAGVHALYFKGHNSLASGIYIYEIRAVAEVLTKKMIHIK